jgi:hypothetical protein
MWGNIGWRPNAIFHLGMGNELQGFSINDINRLGLPARFNVPHVNRQSQDGGRTGAIGPNDAFMHNRFAEGFFVDARPVDMFRIGFGLPFGWDTSWTTTPTLESVLQSTIARARLDIDGVGYAGIGYEGSADDDNYGSFYGVFRMTMIRGMTLELGGRFQTAIDSNEDSERIVVGAGANFTFPDMDMNMGLGLRATAAFGIGDWWDDRDDATRIALDVKPWVDLADNIALGVNIGGAMNMAGSDNDADMHIGWLVNPYFSFNFGAPRFSAGARVFGDNGRGGDAFVGWEIPIGFNISF